jgi:predicted GNAT superfamily acetyltransferase
MLADAKPNPVKNLSSALDALRPDRFDFATHHHGWQKAFPVAGQVAFASLAWPHAQVSSFDDSSGEHEITNALGLLVSLQQQVWGFPPAEAVPVNVLSILEDTGGGVIVAYDPDKGFNAHGWLGFAIGMGTRSGVLYSHMLGVREDVRGINDLGWHLKVLQGYLAIESGHHAMTWTFDPMRGANARLNLEKLGARMVNLTIDKYGVMRSSLYGDVPTDRFTAYWDLLDPATLDRVQQVYEGLYRPLSLDDVEQIPEATIETLPELRRQCPEAIRYQIPGDIDALMRSQPDQAIRWRQEMRDVLGALMTRRRARMAERSVQEGPIAVDMEIEQGPYVATGFATGFGPGEDERTSYYILTKESAP